MSSDTLTQQEIDRLFGAGAGAGAAEPAGVEPAAERASRGDVQSYDFRRPNRVSKDRQRALEAMYGRLAKSLEGWLTGRVRGGTELTLLSVEQFSYGEFLLSLPAPCASYVFDLEGAAGQQAIIDVAPDLAFFLVDRMLGGTGDCALLDRALTPLERLVVRLAAERAAHLLDEIWADAVPLRPVMNRFESMPDMLQIVNREDPVLVANLQVVAGELRGLLLICLPFVVVEKFFTGGGPRRPAERASDDGERALERVALESTVRTTRVPVTVRFPAWRVRLGTVAALRPGALLDTPLSPDCDVDILIAGRARFRGTPGRAGRHVAASVAEPIEDQDPDALAGPTR